MALASFVVWAQETERVWRPWGGADDHLWPIAALSLGVSRGVPGSPAWGRQLPPAGV